MFLGSSEELKRLNRLHGELSAMYHEAARRLGLSDSAMNVLYTLCSEGGSCLLSDVIRQSGLSKQTVNSAIRKLEADGIAYLQTAGARAKRLCLTEAGQRLAGQTAQRLIQAESELLGAWLPEECQCYLALTERYVNEMKKRAATL